MNAPILRSPHPRLKRVLQEPLTFIIFVWVLMLAFVGLCFALVD